MRTSTSLSASFGTAVLHGGSETEKKYQQINKHNRNLTHFILERIINIVDFITLVIIYHGAYLVTSKILI